MIAPMIENETLNQSLERIQQEWGLTDLQMASLSHVEEQTYVGWKMKKTDAPNSPAIPPGMNTAVPVVSIYKALVRNFPETEDRIKWLFKENGDFGGNKPIDIATSSVENLFWMSYYLDFKRG
ncbi:MAG: hypothetical protein ABIQ95_12495 [Bdellovibrionia bacterium]